MTLKELKTLGAYLGVGLVSIALAFFVATQFVTPSSSQTPEPPPAPEVEIQMPPPAQGEVTVDAPAAPPPSEGGVENPVEGAMPPPMPEGELPPPAEGAQPGEGGIPDSIDGVPIPKFTDFQTFLEPFIYDPKNRKDPFKPYVEVEPVDQGELQGPLLPLQRFDLNEIRLVGIIWEVREPKAMFLDPTNTVHIIGKNERIGRNNGYIAVIREGEVVVVEATRKEDEVIYTTTVMKISR
ncbi:MAG: pilus assembly protein PilP [Bdellovibrionaceae bacterium]|nr:pilus assembly protein PilP [Bdellovibrionales bacterium]MCB9086094.1 pilus assembly protein PilP [Pseudobdellovibrionaceae bacterium]